MKQVKIRQAGADMGEAVGLREKIIALVQEALNVPEGTITEDTLAADVEQWDSLAHVMIIGELEEQLGIAIPLDEAAEIQGMRELLESAGRYAWAEAAQARDEGR